jgi:hypothetical protein
LLLVCVTGCTGITFTFLGLEVGHIFSWTKLPDLLVLAGKGFLVLSWFFAWADTQEQIAIKASEAIRFFIVGFIRYYSERG